MTGSASASPLRRATLLLFLLCLLLFFFRLGARALWDIDEGMHAAMAKNMVSSGDWVTPVLNGEPFFDKPVLYTWAGALSIRLLGVSELAARFPSALFGLGTVLLTMLLGRRMSGTPAGLMAGLILATSLEFVALSRAVVHDVALTFFFTLSLFLFYSGVVDERRRGSYFLLFYGAAGLAVLTKGPVGLALPALIAAVYLIVSRQPGLFKELRIGWGALVILAVVCPWYVAMSFAHPNYLSDFLLRQNLGSFLSYEARHPQPTYYYLPVLIAGLLPWSGLVPVALYRAVRRRDDASRRGARFLVVWTAVTLVFFSAAVSKLPTYVLPLFPAVALLVARAWQELLTAPTPSLHRSFLWSQLPVVAAAAAVPVLFWNSPELSLESRYGADQTTLLGLLVMMAFGLLVAYLFLWTRRYRASLATVSASVVGVVVYFGVLLAPAIDAYRSTKQLSVQADGLLPPGERLVFYRVLKDSALFYTDREAVVLYGAPELETHLASGPERLWLAEDEDLEIVAGLADRWTVIETVGGTSLIQTSRAAAEERWPKRRSKKKPPRKRSKRSRVPPGG